MTAAEPFFSVVTATFNAASDLPTLIESLLRQTEQSWEWVVHDGASTDETVQTLLSVGDVRVRVQSAPDNGIYDGLNRAIARATGQYVLVLGADDRLAGRDVLSDVRALIERADHRPDVVLGSAQMGDTRLFRSSLGPKTLLVNTVHHQGAFYARSEFAEFRFDQNAPVVADYEHSLRLYLRRAERLRTDVVIARCGDTGISRTSNERRLYAEMHSLRSKHVPAFCSRALQVAGMANVSRRSLQRRMHAIHRPTL